MSTRTQLRFVNSDGDRVAQVYNHSDGYPAGIIPSLVELRETLTETGWHRGPEYAAAQFIFMRKLDGLRFYADRIAENLGALREDDVSDRLVETLIDETGATGREAECMARMAAAMTSPEVIQQLDQPFFLGGHGVETGNIHGDEEYIYEVTVPMNSRDGREWEVKVSEKKWDGGFESPAWETHDGETKGFDYPEGETAWDHARWDYVGDLDGAVEKYTEE